MLFIYDKSSVQARVKWKIKDENILSGKNKITYISPGGFIFKTKDDKEICFDFNDSGSDLDLKKGIITSELFSLDYEYINDNLKEKGYENLIKEKHGLELFKDFEEVVDAYCFIDVDMCEQEVEMECIYFELFDPKSEEIIMLIGEYDNE